MRRSPISTKRLNTTGKKEGNSQYTHHTLISSHPIIQSRTQSTTEMRENETETHQRIPTQPLHPPHLHPQPRVEARALNTPLTNHLVQENPPHPHPRHVAILPASVRLYVPLHQPQRPLAVVRRHVPDRADVGVRVQSGDLARVVAVERRGAAVGVYDQGEIQRGVCFDAGDVLVFGFGVGFRVMMRGWGVI